MKMSEFLDMVVKESKNQKWHIAYHEVNGIQVGIKQYGKWIQILSANSFKDGIPEQKTQKALREKVESLLIAMNVPKD